MSPFLELFCVFVIMALFAYTFISHDIKRKKTFIYYKDNGGKGSVRRYADIPKEQILKYNITNLDGLKKNFYNKFFEFYKAYNNLDFDMMKKLSTKQLFHNYHIGLTLNSNGNKSVIDEMSLNNIYLFKIRSSNNGQTYSFLIDVNCLDYKIDKYGRVLEGNKNSKVNTKFVVVFKKKSENSHCPNCGAKLSNGNCSYCKTIIKDNDFKISSIKKIYK